jgi:hypothetical protein
LQALAGKVKAKYGDRVKVNVVRPQDRQHDGDPHTPEAPRLAVDGETLPKRITLSELDQIVSRKLALH